MKTRVLMLGLSTYAEFLLNALHESGDAEIVAVDKDEETVNRVADRVSRPVIGHATNPDLLAELHVPDMDYVVVSMGSLESSVVCVLYLKELGARQIVVKALNNEHVKVLELLGVEEIVFPERAVGHEEHGQSVSLKQEAAYEIPEQPGPRHGLHGDGMRRTR